MSYAYKIDIPKWIKLSVMSENGYIELKNRLIAECTKVQQRTVNSSKSAMDEAQQSLNEYGPNKDRYDSFRDQLIGRRDMFSLQYSKAYTELSVMSKLNPKSINKIAELLTK